MSRGFTLFLIGNSGTGPEFSKGGECLSEFDNIGIGLLSTGWWKLFLTIICVKPPACPQLTMYLMSAFQGRRGGGGFWNTCTSPWIRLWNWCCFFNRDQWGLIDFLFYFTFSSFGYTTINHFADQCHVIGWKDTIRKGRLYVSYFINKIITDESPTNITSPVKLSAHKVSILNKKKWSCYDWHDEVYDQYIHTKCHWLSVPKVFDI